MAVTEFQINNFRRKYVVASVFREATPALACGANVSCCAASISLLEPGDRVVASLLLAKTLQEEINYSNFGSIEIVEIAGVY